MSAPDAGTPDKVTSTDPRPKKEWTPPRLERLGTVAALTNKVDLVGRNDGGSGKMRRT